ncbi:uncharacterized protein LOC134272200 [Saccostrea cucullata]|uniref:uncharacterized protein LOC134272200 n=1 Tax=Saccostrea cuccullata TaxID=36930 RepID=UPI002ED52D86
MKHQGICTIIIPIMISFLETERSSVAACKISEVDAFIHHQLFKDLMQEGSVQLVYINISSSSFQNMSLSEKEWNRVVDWIWVTNEYKHFLSYPIDIDIFTLGLMEDNDRSLKLNISIDDISNCINQTLWIQVFEYLFKTCNVSEGYFCHRYFENQDWKLTLFSLSHAAIGYRFHCYQNNNTAVPIIVEKSAVIYITIAIILLLFSFYPLIVSKSSHETTVQRQLSVYTEADYPYTPRRMLLNIMFKTGEVVHAENISRGQKRANNFYSSARLSLLITIVMGCAFFAKIIVIWNCSNCLPPNAHIYKEVYVTDGVVDGNKFLFIYPILISTFFSFIFLVYFNNYILLISEFDDEILVIDFLSIKFIRCIPVSNYLNHNEESESITTQVVQRFSLMCSLSFWCKIYLLPLINVSKPTCLFYFKVLFSPLIFLFNVVLVIVFSSLPTFNHMYCLALSYVVLFFPNRCKGYIKNHVYALSIAITLITLLLRFGSVI